jgi:hypothetical protein
VPQRLEGIEPRRAARRDVAEDHADRQREDEREEVEGPALKRYGTWMA